MTAPADLHTALAKSALSPDQLRFLSLHVRRCVVQWQWYWSDTLLRAKDEDGRTVSLGRLGVEQLVAWGLMCMGQGHAMYPTLAGKSAAEGT